MAVAKQQEANGHLASQHLQHHHHHHQQQHQQHPSQQMEPMQESNQNCCASCHQPIRDRFIFSVIEQNFHKECVRCVDCSSSLNERCYTFDGKLYCRSDYWRRYGPKCSACQEAIKPTELVQRLKANLVYHLGCFVCQDCKRHLQAGEQLHLIDEKRLLCKRDFNTLMSSQQPQQQQVIPSSLVSQQENQQANELRLAGTPSQLNGRDSPEGAELDDPDERSSTEGGDSMQYAPAYGKGADEGGALKSELPAQADELVDANGKRRGPRTTIKPKQLETLRRAFESAPKPSRHIREQLAAETGLNMRVIQVWFQNRRSKERRMKNSNGSVRRNFFRSSSRRIRVGPAGGATASPAQQSLIAGSRAGKKPAAAAAAQSPMEPGDPLQQAGSGLQRGQHSSPSEFGGSSSGGFTYFSDSSNQGDAFAISSAGQTAPNQQQYHPAAANGAPDQATLMALGSPSGGGQAPNQQVGANNGPSQARGGQQPPLQQQTPPHHNLQHQQHQSMKNTPPPPPQMYQPGPPPLMMMQPGPPLMQHSGPHQMMQTPGLLGHQW